MTTFLNLDFDKDIYWKFFRKHLLYTLLWFLGISIFVFRVDSSLLKMLPENLLWINNVVPFVFIAIVLFVMLRTRWYYNFSLVFYPLLLIFWFVPKTILNKGKIYLLSGYANFIYTRIKRYKSSIVHIVLLTSIILLLVITDSDSIRIISIVYFSFFYFKIVLKYVGQSFQPAQLFGANIDKTLDDLIKSPEHSTKIIKSFEHNKTDENLPEDERNFKRIKRLIIANSIVEILGTNLNSFKGKRAFVIAWVYQLIGFVLLTFTYYTFINLELYIVTPESFKTTLEPSLFDFFYYTMKTVTFGNIESIVPVSVLARIIEIFSFSTVGVFIFIIVTSVIFSFRQDKISANIQKATAVCTSQNDFISKHVFAEYKVDIATVLLETTSIRESVGNIKNSLERIL
ncbi:hypothetical protein [Ancylomarina sp. 16SWW S1-10-2]|uniref:hypothetical protein n=1 Tax=Ancylomarina sp. 16SWW S1-10-2 TaxID=2499681 RepID=UPI0012AD43DF|nr:hypothetical protein [Ancylomarina sp. 16SWW S1-10-2]MRT94358.1 hypothetical protein [Ancylomarina sp. 16SWW S1-10-2]